MKPVLEETLVRVALPEMGESVTEGSIVEWRKQRRRLRRRGRSARRRDDRQSRRRSSGHRLRRRNADSRARRRDGRRRCGACRDRHLEERRQQPTASARRRGTALPRRRSRRLRAIAPPRVRPAQRIADPPARRMARQLDVDLGRVRGSGPNGLILRSDVLAQARERAPRPTRAGGRRCRAIPPDARRHRRCKGPAAALAGYMEQSLSIPTATSFRSAAGRRARRAAQRTQRRDQGRRAQREEFRSRTSSRTRWCAPRTSCRSSRIRSVATKTARPARLEPGIHLGLAVDTRAQRRHALLRRSGHQGCRRRSISRRFAAKYEELVAKARDNKLAADDLQGASFTLTNPGGIGTVASVPRLMAGQGAIIATGAIGYPPGFAGANEQSLRLLGVSKIMQMTSTYDHRVIQGAQSGEYLRRVDELLQGKRRLLRSDLRVARTASARPHTASSPLAPAGAGGGAAVGRNAARGRRRHGDRLGLPAPRPSRGASRSARRAAGRRSFARTANLRSDARAAERDSRRASCASRFPATRWPKCCRTSKKRTARRSPTRSSTSRTPTQRVWLRDYIESGKQQDQAFAASGRSSFSSV